VYDLPFLATGPAAALLGIAVKGWVGRKANQYHETAEYVPHRPDSVDNPSDPDVIIAGYGGSTVRGVRASEKSRQLAAVLQKILSKKLGEQFGIEGFTVAVVHHMSEAEGRPAGLHEQALKTGRYLQEHFRGRSPAASFAVPDIKDPRGNTPFNPDDFRSFFGAVTFPPEEATGSPVRDAPLLVVTPHDFSRSHAVPLCTRGTFRRRVKKYGVSLERMVDEFNTNRRARPIVVHRGDHDFSDTINSDPTRYFDPNTGRDLSDAGHGALAEEIAEKLVPMIVQHAEAMRDQVADLEVWQGDLEGPSRVAAAARKPSAQESFHAQFSDRLRHTLIRPPAPTPGPRAA
ncbi:MAG: hypothetical protein ACRDPW_04910, partial [Mycobacteriales bacterium]